ncbi:CAP domain-containing protein [Clostridium sp. HMP27]|uniref:CAP domain-containing protein n=1 Tax=Clostridium sp. HMP27 TaxID=1487921 RepID=UPI0009DE4380|nr:CAP domain-containing protein [Clostridium sp. HMP27]
MKRLAIFVSTIAIIASLASGCSNSSVEKLAGANGKPIAIENGEGTKKSVDVKEEISKAVDNKETTNTETKEEKDTNVSEDKASTNNEDEKEVIETEGKEVDVRNNDECITDENQWTNIIDQISNSPIKPEVIAPTEQPENKPEVTAPVEQPEDKPEVTAPVEQPENKPEVTTPVTKPEVKPEAPKPTNPENNAGQAGDSQVNEFEKEVVRLTNIERSKEGLKPLTLNVELSKVARIKSKDMVDKKYFDHNSPTYGSPFDMMKSFGISYKAAGENIAYGQRTPEEVVKGWMNSPGHRANILNGNFTEIGVGFYNNYWTQMFIGK